MKRHAPLPRSGNTSGDVKVDLSIDQLAGIGACSIAFNEVEFLLENLLYTSLRLPGALWFDVVKRIKSVEEKNDIAKLAIDELERLITIVFHRPDLTFAKPAKDTLGKISEVKGYRDLIIHSRVFDAQNAIGEKGSYKAKIDQVLLTVAALDWLYNSIISLKLELLEINNFLTLVYGSFQYGPFGPTGMMAGPEALMCLSRLQSHQKSRHSIGPPPSFPEF